MEALTRIRNNFVSLATAEIVTKAFGALMYFVLARYLGPHDFGVYSVALSFGLIFGLVSGLGIDSYLIKEIAREPASTQALFNNSMLIKTVGGMLAFLSAVGMSFLMDYDPQVRAAIMIFSVTLLFSSFTNLVDSVFRGLQRMEYSALILIGRSFFNISIILIMVWLHQNVLVIVSAHVITSMLIVVIFYSILANRRICRVRLAFSREQMRGLVKGGLPFVATGVVYVLNLKADVIMLSKLSSIEDVGIYDAANELILVLMILPSLLSQVLYPYISQRFKQSREELGKIINFSLRVIVAFSVPISLGLIVLAPKFIHLFYGGKYEQSSIVLQIMGAGLSIVFMRSLLGWVLAAIEKVSWMMWVNVLNLGLNLIFNFILIPRYGYVGAAIATIASMIFGTLTVMKVIKSVVKDVKNLVLLYLKPAAAVLPMAAFLMLLPQLNVFVQIFLGAVIYGGGFILVRGFSTKEWHLLRDLLPLGRR